MEAEPIMERIYVDTSSYPENGKDAKQGREALLKFFILLTGSSGFAFTPAWKMQNLIFSLKLVPNTPEAVLKAFREKAQNLFDKAVTSEDPIEDLAQVAMSELDAEVAHL